MCTYTRASAYGCVYVCVCMYVYVCVCACVCVCISAEWDAGRGSWLMYTYIEHLPICVGVCMHVSVYVYVYPQIVGRGSWVAVDIYI